ncbi:MAG: hypothetical protein KIT87_07225 [Anaerolineae bacterium]|nr:hypothetical protein [Anaerolineae bacterium]
MTPATSTKYLLLDPALIEAWDNARLVLGRVEKDPHNPLFVEDKPWEVRFDNLYANVVYDTAAGLYQCWYNPFIMDRVYETTPLAQRPHTVYKPQQREMGLCYAVSRDGIAWDKPDLGIIEFGGSSHNNLVLRAIHGAGVYRDDCDPNGERRFKAFMKEGVAVSPDGLHWSQVAPCPEIEARGDTHNFAFWDVEWSRYVGITRLWDGGQRVVGWTESQDFRHWTKAMPILRSLPDEPHRQTYALLPFRYDSLYLGLLMILDTATDLVDCELAVSQDTQHWDRVCPGASLIPRGPRGSFDWGCIYGAASPLLIDGRLRLYYGGGDDTHGSWRRTGFGLAWLRPDGFAGCAPLDQGAVGRVVTQPVLCSGAQLTVSADAAGGSLRVGVLEADGLSLADCEPIQTDVTDAPVTWRSGRTLAALQGQPVRLVFEAQAATVYSFAFAD